MKFKIYNMLFNRNINLILLILLGVLGNLNAQEYSTIENVTSNTNLQNHTITSIDQDSNGFLWFGTNLGLYRYDGYHFTAFNINSTPSLLDNNVRTILINGNELWVGSKGGIDIINIESKEHISFKNNYYNQSSIASNYVTKIFKDKSNHIWVAYNTNKLSKYLGNGKFQNFTLKNFSDHCSITDIIELAEGKLILKVIDGKPLLKEIILTQQIGNEFVQKNITNNKEIIQLAYKIENVASLVIEDEVYYFDKVIKRFKKSNYTINTLNYDYYGLSYADSTNNVFFGTSKGSFKRVTINDNITIKETYIGNSELRISSFFVDQTNLLWIGTTNGLYKLKEQHFLFNRYLYNSKKPIKMRSIIQDHKGDIYAVGLDGLFKYNEAKKQFIQKEWIDYVDSAPYALIEYDSNNLMVGTQGNGLAIYNKTSNVYKPFETINNSLPPNSHILKLLKDENKTLWIGTSDGLAYFSENKFYKVEDSNLNYLKNDLIFDIKQLKKNEFWIAASTGLYHLKVNYLEIPLKVDIVKMPNIPYEIRSILKSDEILWLATQRNGLLKYNLNTKKATFFDESNGLTNNTTYSILQGVNNELWIGTLNGLSRFDTITKQFINFFDYDGLAGNEFNSSSHLKATNGELFFGGQNGISGFTPSNIKIKETKSNVNITNINWYDSKKDSAYHLDFFNDKIEHIELPHSNAFVNFEFSLSDYFKPENNTFKYRFVGLHNDWRTLSKTNVLSFSNLPPGEYTLEVMASTNYGMWNEQTITLPVKVNQIFYKRWWFLTSLGLLMLLFMYSMRRYELYHIKKLEKLRLRISRDLHDDLGSALTGIAIRSELIMDKKDSKDINEFLNEIAIQSRGAVDTLSDIVWAIDSRNNSLENLADRMHNVLFLLLPPLEITFQFSTVQENKQLFLNQDHRQHIFLIYKEAITNIIKHSNATHVIVSITKDKYNLKLTIKDNGTFTKKTKITLNGNGIRNMKLRAEKIKGDLQIFYDNGYTIELLFDFLY